MSSRKAKNTAFYVLFGFNAAQAAAHDDDESMNAEPETGYWTQQKIVSALQDAALFPDKNKFGIEGFGTPQQWCEFINDDKSLNHGYKLHLVKTCLTAADYEKQTGRKLQATEDSQLKAKRKPRTRKATKTAKKMPMREA